MKKTSVVVAALLLAAMCGCRPWNVIRRPKKPVTLKDYPELCAALERNNLAESVENRVLVVALWTRPSPYCVKETIPHLKTLHGNYHSLGLRIVGINVDSDLDREALDAFIAENHIKYPNIFDDGDISGELKVDGYPTIYVFDRSGVLVRKDFEPTDKKGLDELIAELINAEE